MKNKIEKRISNHLFAIQTYITLSAYIGLSIGEKTRYEKRLNKLDKRLKHLKLKYPEHFI